MHRWKTLGRNGLGLKLDVYKVLAGCGLPGKIRLAAKLLGAHVAQVLEERNQGFSRDAERIGDPGRRGTDCGSAYDANLFQFTELRGENFFADAAEKIAELREAERAKRKAPDRLDSPLAAQDVDSRLN